jgi:hypothetical protein
VSPGFRDAEPAENEGRETPHTRLGWNCRTVCSQLIDTLNGGLIQAAPIDIDSEVNFPAQFPLSKHQSRRFWNCIEERELGAEYANERAIWLKTRH